MRKSSTDVMLHDLWKVKNEQYPDMLFITIYIYLIMFPLFSVGPSFQPKLIKSKPKIGTPILILV